MVGFRACTAFLMYALMTVSLVTSGSMAWTHADAGLATQGAHVSAMDMGSHDCAPCGCTCTTGHCSSCLQCGASPAEVIAAGAATRMSTHDDAIRFTRSALAVARTAPEPPPPRS